MTLQSSGAISLADVRSELGASGAISLGGDRVRTVANKITGGISLGDLYGGRRELITLHSMSSISKWSIGRDDRTWAGYDGPASKGTFNYSHPVFDRISELFEYGDIFMPPSYFYIRFNAKAGEGALLDLYEGKTVSVTSGITGFTVTGPLELYRYLDSNGDVILEYLRMRTPINGSVMGFYDNYGNSTSITIEILR